MKFCRKKYILNRKRWKVKIILVNVLRDAGESIFEVNVANVHLMFHISSWTWGKAGIAKWKILLFWLDGVREYRIIGFYIQIHSSNR